MSFVCCVIKKLLRAGRFFYMLVIEFNGIGFGKVFKKPENNRCKICVVTHFLLIQIYAGPNRFGLGILVSNSIFAPIFIFIGADNTYFHIVLLYIFFGVTQYLYCGRYLACVFRLPVL